VWVGGHLSPLAAASMRSFVGLGHDYRLYAYEPIDGVPEGVTVEDAEPWLPQRKIVYLMAQRAYPLVSNLFRFSRLRAGGLYVDTDLIALRPFDFDPNALIFAWQDEQKINAAVLGAPEGDPLIETLYDRTLTPRLWYPWVEPEPSAKTKLRRRVGALRHGPTYVLKDAPWGVAGPDLTTAVVRDLGLEGAALGTWAFYPIPWQEVDLLLDPNGGGGAAIVAETYAVHLWDELLRRRAIDRPPAGSLLERLVAPHRGSEVALG
jgi:hypothetical protein